MSKAEYMPAEIIALVIEDLTFSEQPYEDICAASLISHAWREPAQRWLFSQLTMDIDLDCGKEVAIAYGLSRLAFFSARPDLARHVRSLGVVNPLPQILNAALLQLLVRIPNVTSYRFYAYTLQEPGVAAVLINSWTYLEHVEFIFWAYTPYHHFLLHPTNPTAVHLRSIDFRAAPHVMADLLNYLAHTSTQHTLRFARLEYNPEKGSHDAAWFSKSLQILYEFANLEGLDLVLGAVDDAWISRNCVVPGTCSFLGDNMSECNAGQSLTSRLLLQMWPLST
jgi:hypothetical protein